MKFLLRSKPSRLHESIITRTSPTPTPPQGLSHALPTAEPPVTAPFSSATHPRKLRPPPSSSSSSSSHHPRTYSRSRTPPLPTTSINNSRSSTTTAIFASPLLLPFTAAAEMSSVSTPASTQPAASSTPPRPPPSESNHDAAADASHARPLPTGASGGVDPHSKDSSCQDTSGDGSSDSALPALPAPDSNNNDGTTTTTTLEVDGKAVVLDHLGPMVVGRDGTVSRIGNWNEMSELERRNALRILGNRNQVRLAALRGQSEDKAA